jgi:hypothetical protein
VAPRDHLTFGLGTQRPPRTPLSSSSSLSFFLLDFFFVVVESLSLPRFFALALLVESLSEPLVESLSLEAESPEPESSESLSDESLSDERLSDERLSDERLLLFLAPLEPESLPDESLSLLPRLSLSDSSASSSALAERDDELAPCP